jgi:hypothetical protein
MIAALTEEAIAAVLVRHPYSFLRGGRYVCSGCGAPAGILGSGMNAAHAAHLGAIVAFIVKTAQDKEPTNAA